jgi:hypothetical protein
MKVIWTKSLGCIVAGSEVNYSFMVVDEDCATPCPHTAVLPVVTKGEVEITPKRIITDEFGVGKCRIALSEQACGVTNFQFLPVPE